MGDSWHSYPSIFNLGHAAVKDIFSQPFIVQEKIDGSQFSFGVFEGKLRVKSKGQEMDPLAPQKMFAKAVDTVGALADRGCLREGWTYRGEVLDKPKHNVLAYDRVPKDNVIIFDVNDGEESYLDWAEMVDAAADLGLEAVPTFMVSAALEPMTKEGLAGLLQTESILGGQKVEGVVVKSLALYGHDKKRLMAKFVSEAFKETHAKVWGENVKGQKDSVARIVAGLKTDARWAKAVIHLREQGKLSDSPRDIPLLMNEVHEDVWKDEGEEIKTALVSAFKREIDRGITAGLPEWWKQQLVDIQFAEVAA